MKLQRNPSSRLWPMLLGFLIFLRYSITLLFAQDIHVTVEIVQTLTRCSATLSLLPVQNDHTVSLGVMTVESLFINRTHVKNIEPKEFAPLSAAIQSQLPDVEIPFKYDAKIDRGPANFSNVHIIESSEPNIVYLIFDQLVAADSQFIQNSIKAISEQAGFERGALDEKLSSKFELRGIVEAAFQEGNWNDLISERHVRIILTEQGNKDFIALLQKRSPDEAHSAEEEFGKEIAIYSPFNLSGTTRQMIQIGPLTKTTLVKKYKVTPPEN